MEKKITVRESLAGGGYRIRKAPNPAWNGSPTPRRSPPVHAPKFKTCIVCRAKVPVDAEGNIPEGGMPCGH